MSLFYALLIENLLDGKFSFGRCAEFIPLDVIIFILWRILRYERLRWRRLIKIDREAATGHRASER